MKAIAVKRGPKGFKATLCICSVKKLFIYVNVKIAAKQQQIQTHYVLRC